jgi:hypothetical protein
MKVIISHDIDHLTVNEHLTDSIIPKFIIRNHIELIKGYISFNEYKLRWSKLFKNKWNNISELIEFNKKQDIPSTFFIGVNNGVGLNYSLELSAKWIERILKTETDCGVHGIAFNDFESVKKEHDTFKEISGLDNFGIRMHYLRNDDKTLGFLNKAGYIFDSTDYGIKPDYKIGKMHEFPLHIMDGYELESGKRWQSADTKTAIETTIRKINKAINNNIDFLTILFHDRYFDDSFLSWKKWYTETIKYCKSQGFEFIDFRTATTYK